MKVLLRLAIIISLVLILVLAGLPVGAFVQSSSPAFASDHILVKYKSSVSSRMMQAAHYKYGTSDLGQVSGRIHRVQVPDGTVLEQVQAYRSDPVVEYAEPDYLVQAVGTPDDTELSRQWGLAKVQAAQAWDQTTGSSEVKIAILDSGIDQDHPDLASKIVANQNYSNSSTSDDLYGHGTHVAGIAAAVTNNGAGIAGLGYNSSLMNVKVLGDSGTGYDSWVADGITWAADNGAKVINLSLSGPHPSQTLEDAVNYAWNKGVVIIAAAGNTYEANENYPAACANCIAVAATDQDDLKTDFSTYGTWVDVAAPGLAIYSTLPDQDNHFNETNYGYLSGTSMSAPLVSGLAALVWSTPYGVSNASVRNRIETTADSVTGTGTQWQYGRINAYRAVDHAALEDKIAFTSYRNGNYPEIYVMNSDGSNQTRLTNGNSLPDGQNDFMPALSPDNSKIVFVSDRDGVADTYLINTDGSNVTRLTNNAYPDSDPAWSFDGSKIAFSTFVDGIEQIYTMNADGSNLKQITVDGGRKPAWSPDGNQIVFISSREGFAVNIYRINSDGTSETRLTNEESIQDISGVSWSPDGSRIIYGLIGADSNSLGLIVVNADGSGRTSLPLAGALQYACDPAWSKDGLQIVFYTTRTPPMEIFSVDSTGNNLNQLTNTDTVGTGVNTGNCNPSCAVRSKLPPVVTTGVASGVISTESVLNGSLSSLGAASTVQVSFEYGIQSGGPYTSETTPQSLEAPGDFNIKLTGLTPDTAYYFRAKALGVSTAHGVEQTFRTSPISFYLTVNISGKGSVTRNPDLASYSPGDSVQLTAVPAAGWRFSTWNGALSVKTNPAALAIDQDKTVTAVFVLNSPPSGSGGGGGGGGFIAPPSITVTLDGLSSTGNLTTNSSGVVKESSHLHSSDGILLLDIPAGTVLKGAGNSKLTSLSAHILTASSPAPEGESILLGYEFGPAGAVFDPALTLTLKYAGLSLPLRAGENDLYLAYWDGQQWVKLESQLDTAAKTISTMISHFSGYALLVKLPPPLPANLVINGIEMDHLDVIPGDPVTIRTVVSNIGELSGSQTLVLNINGLAEDEQLVTLEPGASQTVTFQVTRSEPGDYVVDIAGKQKTFHVMFPYSATDNNSIEVNPEIPAPAEETVAPVTIVAPVVSGVPETAPASSTPTTDENRLSVPLSWFIIPVVLVAIILGIFLISVKRKPAK